MPRHPQVDLRTRFYSKVRKTDGCWLWTAGCTGQGRGCLRVDGKMMLAHRVAWLLEYDSLPDRPLEICHKCDVPTCVYPAHLFVGTHADNMRDMAIKGRYGSLPGELNPRAKLAPHDVRMIRESRLNDCQLARELGMSSSTIRNIRLRILWSHI